MADFLDIAVRGYVASEPVGTKRNFPSLYRRPEHLLVFDTETSTDASQRLLFGSYRYYRVSWQGISPRLACVEEGLFYADNLPQVDPAGFAALVDYAQRQEAEVVEGVPRRLRLLSRREFLDQILFPAGYRLRATVVAFNFPFDLSRLAVAWAPARFSYDGGISLTLWEYQDKDGHWREDRYRPRVAVKNIDSKRALKGFTGRNAPDRVDRIPDGASDGKAQTHYCFRGHFLDLRTLAFALTDRSYSLDSACADFGVEQGKVTVAGHGAITREYITYNRGDVRATAALYVKLAQEFERHPLDLAATQAYSPASISKAYLRGMGICPRSEQQPDFPPDVLGYAMVGYYGGRSECRIRRVPVPVVYCDFLSMYPTVNALMELWQFVIADRVGAIEDTEAVRQFVDEVSLDDCFDPETWRQLPVLVQVDASGDLLPTRADYQGSGWQIGLNPLTAQWPLWYPLADVVAAKVLSGKAPRILRAIRLVPEGVQPNLRPVRLRGEVEIDPRRDDLFRRVIEERKRLAQRSELTSEERGRLDRALKTLASSGSYGVYAEITRREGPAGDAVSVYGFDGGFRCRVDALEEPGAFSFPPLAACITAAARLMLALLERLVTDHGGTYAICDTDSLAIVASEKGGLVPCPGGSHRVADGKEAVLALPRHQVKAIVDAFAQLNPYDRDVVPGSILKIEDENFASDSGDPQALYCLAISAKRYALFNLDDDGRPILRKWSEHGLGHLLNPIDPESEDRDWIRQSWETHVCEALSLPDPELRWLDRPAVTRLNATSAGTLAPFARYNADREFAEQVKPFNFLLAVQVAPFGHPRGYDPSRFQLVAPYQSDPRTWLQQPWVDRYSGASFSISASGQPSRDVVRVKSYGDVLAEHGLRPEAKSLGLDGKRCRRATRGVLIRRPVIAATLTYIGKESNALDEAKAGLFHDLREILSGYEDDRVDTWVDLVCPILKQIPKAALAEVSGLSERAVTAVRNGHSRPRPAARTRLITAAGSYARAALDADRAEGASSDLAACAAYINATKDIGACSGAIRR